MANVSYVVLAHPLRKSKETIKLEKKTSLLNPFPWYEAEKTGIHPIVSCMAGNIITQTAETLVLYSNAINLTVTYKNLSTQFYDVGKTVQRGQVVGMTMESRNLIVKVQDSNTGNFMETKFI